MTRISFFIFFCCREGNRRASLILAYVNGYYLSRQASKILGEKYEIDAMIVDLH